MPVFEYKALTAGGKSVQGLKEADSPKTLRAALRRDGVFLTEVLGEQQQKAQATRQLAVLVHAGIPLVEALTALVEQVDHEKLKRVLGDVKQRVNEGSSLADALAAHPRVFGDLYVNMIRAGEHSGALEVVLVRLADFTESQARLRSKILGTMAYPVAMMVIGSIVLGVLFTVVIPRVTKLFADTKATLPWTTRALMAFTGFVTQFWWAILALAALGLWGFFRWKHTPAGKARWHRFVLTVPIFGRLVRII